MAKKKVSTNVDKVAKTRKKPIEKKMDEQITIEVINTSDNPLPEYQTLESVGMDVRAASGLTILQGQTKVVLTGIYMDIPNGFEVQVRSRSGLAVKGIQVANGVGSIDSDYRGECNVILYNSSREVFKIGKGDRVAQFVLSRKPRLVWKQVDNLSETARGTGGFGSTGIK